MLVEVFNSTDNSEGHLAYTLLEGRGFFVRLENEYMSQIPGMSRGISILVREEDYSEARAVLEEAGYVPRAEDDIARIEAQMAAERKTLARRMTFIIVGIIVLLVISYFFSRMVQPV